MRARRWKSLGHQWSSLSRMMGIRSSTRAGDMCGGPGGICVGDCANAGAVSGPRAGGEIHGRQATRRAGTEQAAPHRRQEALNAAARRFSLAPPGRMRGDSRGSVHCPGASPGASPTALRATSRGSPPSPAPLRTSHLHPLSVILRRVHSVLSGCSRVPRPPNTLLSALAAQMTSLTYCPIPNALAPHMHLGIPMTGVVPHSDGPVRGGARRGFFHPSSGSSSPALVMRAIR